ncbi:MAG: glycosyltransferase family 2 protein [Candidatus Omnitrophica bacterium]|nr:glycosyltransferase family 2 protein [Candidatus Omnitrophota bacterium]
MIKGPCILIPSYNEERTIGEIVRKLKERKFTIYVVDDGSSDATALKASEEGAVVIKNGTNMGKGAAMRTGFDKILEEGKFDSVIVMDGDDQHDVDDIANLIKKAHESGADLVLGNRMRDTSRMPIVRIATNRFMSWLLSVMTGRDIPDTQCGFRLIKTGLLRKISLRSSNYDIDSEMILKAAKAGFKIDSAPVKTVYKDEKSNINPFVDTLRFMRLLILNAFRG